MLPNFEKAKVSNISARRDGLAPDPVETPWGQSGRPGLNAKTNGIASHRARIDVRNAHLICSELEHSRWLQNEFYSRRLKNRGYVFDGPAWHAAAGIGDLNPGI